jgi:hypothetical protein
MHARPRLRLGSIQALIAAKPLAAWALELLAISLSLSVRAATYAFVIVCVCHSAQCCILY